MSVPTFSAMNPALQLGCSFEGRVKVLIDELEFKDLNTGTTAVPVYGLRGCTKATIKSVSLFVNRIGKPVIAPLSKTLNGFECIEPNEKEKPQIVSEVNIDDTLPVDPGNYTATLRLRWLPAGGATVSEFTVAESFTYTGDMITPEIVEVTQGAIATDGTHTLKLKISPNSYEGLSPLITGVHESIRKPDDPAGILESVVIMRDNAIFGEPLQYAHDGIYDIPGLVANQEYNFAVYMKSKDGYLSEVSDLVIGSPVKTQAGQATASRDGSKGDYFVSFTGVTRAALVDATEKEQEDNQMKFAEIYEYTHAADELDIEDDVIPEDKFKPVRTIKSTIHPDGSSSIPTSDIYFEGPEDGKFKRHFMKITNGHGTGKAGARSTVRVLSDTVSKPTVSCSSLGGNKYQIAVLPGKAVTGFTLLAYKVTTTATGTFSELNDDATEILLNDNNSTLYLDAIEKVTSSNVLGKADIVSFKAVSKVNLQLTSSTDFTVSAVGIYERTTELKQLLPLGSEVSGADLRLKEAVWPTTQTWPAGTGSVAPTDTLKRQTLVYGTASKVFADAGYNAYVPAVAPSTTNYIVATSKSILAADLLSDEAKTETVTPVTPITSATWTPASAATFVSASADSATYKMEMAKYDLSSYAPVLNGGGVTNKTHTVTHFILKKNKSSEWEVIRSFAGSDQDQSRVSAQFDVPRGQRSIVGVQVSVYDILGKLVAQSAITPYSDALLPSGEGAFSGCALMTQADQGVVAFDLTDFKSVLNRAAISPITPTTCKARIAFEVTGDFVDAARMGKGDALGSWTRDTKIYKLDKEGRETGSDLAAATPTTVSFNGRTFEIHTLTGLTAMESVSFQIHRDGYKAAIQASAAGVTPVVRAEAAENIHDAEPVKVTVVPAIPVNKPLVNYAASDGEVACVFDRDDTVGAEKNTAEELKAIKAQGGIFNAVFVKNAEGKYDQLAQSSSAHFSSDIDNGTYLLAACAQYPSPSFGKDYNIDNQYVKSELTSDSSQKFGPGPATLDATVISTKDSIEVTSATNYGCLFTWPELASDCTVEIRAIFDDAEDENDDEYAVLFTGLKGTQKFIKHVDIYGTNGGNVTGSLNIGAADYYENGVTFWVVQRQVDKDIATGNVISTTYSAPKVLFHKPVGQTIFTSDDFDVISGPSQLTIKYNKTDDADVYADFAGNSVIPARISYSHMFAKDSATVLYTHPAKDTEDITGADGVTITGLSDAYDYAISIAIDGQVDALGKPAFFRLNTTAVPNKTYSPSPMPKAVTELKALPIALSATSLGVTFTASRDANNGEYSGATIRYRAYVSTVENKVTKYLTHRTVTGTGANQVTTYTKKSIIRSPLRETVGQVGTGQVGTAAIGTVGQPGYVAASGNYVAASADYVAAYDRDVAFLAAGTTLAGLTKGSSYNVELESIFTLDGHSDQKVSAFTDGIASALPVIKYFKFDPNNKNAKLVVDLQGSKLITLLLLANTGAMLPIDLAGAGTQQTDAIRDESNLSMSIAVPAGITNVVGIVVNSVGAAWNGSPAGTQGPAAVTDNGTTGLAAYTAVKDIAYLSAV